MYCLLFITMYALLKYIIKRITIVFNAHLHTSGERVIYIYSIYTNNKLNKSNKYNKTNTLNITNKKNK